MQNTTRFNLFYTIAAILGIILVHEAWMGYQSIKPLAYSEFQTLIREGKVKEVIITRDEIRGELKYPDPPNRKYFRTTRVDNGLAEELQKL
ncbi:ATP-dependent metallopeptidase FtsH/Yme1/Tma family protein [Desulfobacter postgatei]|uniref:ATP-dependent metallopeptidase FtsH/Yme1/Tma family protein n=1 Tax=Desulfobacter postgatei TaxID=2293 RepID=UPI00259B27EB|nr:ATP-dependent metallopeptidase FtsH/Yme1/Tma family protein [uncultured Desulfobacter sp.]